MSIRTQRLLLNLRLTDFCTFAEQRFFQESQFGIGLPFFFQRQPKAAGDALVIGTIGNIRDRFVCLDLVLLHLQGTFNDGPVQLTSLKPGLN